MQAKLIVGAPNDPLEQEADRVADAIVSRPLPAAPEPRNTPTAGPSAPPGSSAGSAQVAASAPVDGVIRRECTACSKEDDESVVVQPKATAGSGAELSAPSGFAEGLQRARVDGGRALDPTIRIPMERKLSHDFSQVRIRDDSRAAGLSQQIRARAFTVGRDVFFNRGEFRPGERAGQKLIAHELTHVVQQGGRSPVIRRAPQDAGGNTEEVVRLVREKLTGFVNNEKEREILALLRSASDLRAVFGPGGLDRRQVLRRFHFAEKRELKQLLKAGLGSMDASEPEPLGDNDTTAPEQTEQTAKQPEPSGTTTAPPPTTSGKKLWVLGGWKKPAKWNNKRAEAYDAYHSEFGDRWAPSLEDFRAASPRADAVLTTRAQLQRFIKAQGRHGISELNIVGHGSPGGVALHGDIIPPTLGLSHKGKTPGSTVDVQFDSYAEIGNLAFDTSSYKGDTLNMKGEPDYRKSVGVGDVYFDDTINEDYRSYFAPGAVINLFACNLAPDPSLPGEIGKDLCTQVRAPGKYIIYCPTIADDGSHITNRARVALGGHGASDQGTAAALCVGVQSSFVGLIPNMLVATPPCFAGPKPKREEIKHEEPSDPLSGF